MIDAILEDNVDEVISKESLHSKLKSGKNLRIKLGVDPTRPDLHIGHAVVLKKLRQFQDLGHTVIFLIGDYTTKIGDPSGRSSARPVLSDEEITANTKTYLDQVGKILDLTKCEVRKNSEWFEKMTFADLLTIVGKVTVAQVIEREDFKKRLSQGHDVGIHELLYPIMQGYDSVELKADVELGGQDQRLNVLMGRDLQKKYGQTPQDIVVMPLLIGTDGSKKMSKSEDNYIALSDSAADMFGKIMSIPDAQIENYLNLASDFTVNEISSLLSQMKDGNPRDVKAKLAQNIVKQYHSLESSVQALDNFDSMFRDKQMPESIKEIKASNSKSTIADALVEFGLAQSKSQAQRLVEQGGVRIDGQVVNDGSTEVEFSKPTVLQVGKLNFVKILPHD